MEKAGEEAKWARGYKINPDPLSKLAIKIKISRLWSIPDHQQDIRCKAPRSDKAYGAIRRKEERSKATPQMMS
jgi:hypothetical protein